MRLSVVATLFQSAAHIAEFHRRATAAAKQVAGNDYEILLVNDGSPDDSRDLALGIAMSDTHVVVVDLSRNFGHHKAMMTGLTQARGDLVFLIDSDLEEEPECLVSFAAQLDREKCDVVYGVQTRRRGRWFEQVSGFLFYRLFRALSGVPLPDNIAVARLMTRQYVNALVRYQEREVFMAGLWVLAGFEQRPQFITKHRTSKTTYTLNKRFGQLVDSVTSFSSAPLVGIFYTGLVVFAAAAAGSGYLAFRWIFQSRPPSGWTSVIASVWLLGGLIILFVGVVGIYVSKVFSEAKRRPYTVVRQVHGREDRDRANIGGDDEVV